MKQYHCPNLGPKPYTYDEIRDKFPSTLASIRDLEVGESAVDCDGDLWVRKGDVADEPLQDDVPMTGEDVAECRASASRVRQSLRLERIATAALQGLCANSYDGHQNRPLSTASYAEMAECAVGHAKALIAELDKQA